MTKTISRMAVLSSAFIVALMPLTDFASAAGATRVYTHADSGHTVRVAEGQKFKVRLKVCEDCGYRWSFAKRPNKKVVSLVHKTDVSSAKPPAVGGINTVTWTYKCVGAGTTTLKLVQRTPAHKVAKRFTLTIKGHPRLVVDG